MTGISAVSAGAVSPNDEIQGPSHGTSNFVEMLSSPHAMTLSKARLSHGTIGRARRPRSSISASLATGSVKERASMALGVTAVVVASSVVARRMTPFGLVELDSLESLVAFL